MIRLKKRKSRICMIGIFLVVCMLISNSFILLISKDQYTDKFLKDLSREELIVTKMQQEDSEETIKGILKDGELVEPKTNEDKMVLKIIDIANSEFCSIPMQLRYCEVDEEKIKNKVKIINEKFTDKNIFVGIERKKNSKGEEYEEKRIYSYPSNCLPDSRITD